MQCTAALDLIVRLSTCSPQAMQWVKDKLQLIMIFSAPFVVQLPAGVFCYWVPSALFGLVQTTTLRQPATRKLLGLPHGPTRPPS